MGILSFSVWFAAFLRSQFGLRHSLVLSSAWLEQAHAARAKHVCARVGVRAWGACVLSLVCGVSAFSVWFATFPRSEFGFLGASARSTCRGHVCARGDCACGGILSF